MHTLRSHIDNVFLEFLYTDNSQYCFIIIDGLPTNSPSKRNFMVKLLNRGFSSIAFRYQGTWESKGLFLQKPPSIDVKLVISQVQNKLLLDYYNDKYYDFTNKKFVLIGSSFGGAVVLDSLFSNIYKFVLLSPVVDMKKYNDLSDGKELGKLKHFLKNGYGNAYNFADENWEKMCNGELFATDYEIVKNRNSDIILFHSEDDRSVSISSINDFINLVDLENYYILQNYSHINYDKIDDYILDKIEVFINN